MSGISEINFKFSCSLMSFGVSSRPTVLGNLLMPGCSTTFNLDLYSRARAYCACSGCRLRLFIYFFLIPNVLFIYF